MSVFSKGMKSQGKLIITIIPVSLLTMIFFFVLTRTKVTEMSCDNLELSNRRYSLEITEWANRTLGELEIYNSIATELGMDNQKTFDVLDTSYGKSAAYPYGLYWGNVSGDFYDASGWIPEEGYVPAERNWYIEGSENEHFAFGQPYTDARTGRICVSATAGVGPGAADGVLAADVYLDYPLEIVTKMAESEIELAFFTSADGIIIADSDSSAVGMQVGESAGDSLYGGIGQLLKAGECGLHTLREKDGIYYVYIDYIECTDWYLISCMRRDVVLKDLRQMELSLFVVSVLGAILIILVTLRVARELSYAYRKAKTDPLTKILNRDGFREMVMIGMEAHPNQGLMMIIDMDNFKRVNDTMGHPEGDLVLKEFAGLLEAYFNRNKDIVARIGGDEFAVFVGREIREQETNVMLSKFMERFHEVFDEKYSGIGLSISIGCAFDTGDISFKELYGKADKALYRVKGNCKNGFGF